MFHYLFHANQSLDTHEMRFSHFETNCSNKSTNRKKEDLLTKAVPLIN